MSQEHLRSLPGLSPVEQGRPEAGAPDETMPELRLVGLEYSAVAHETGMPAAPAPAEQLAEPEVPLDENPALILRQVAHHFITTGRASESIVKNRFRLSGSDTGLVMRELERRRIVGPRDPNDNRNSAHVREVLAKPEEADAILPTLTAVPESVVERFNGITQKAEAKKDYRKKPIPAAVQAPAESAPVISEAATAPVVTPAATAVSHTLAPTEPLIPAVSAPPEVSPVPVTAQPKAEVRAVEPLTEPIIIETPPAVKASVFKRLKEAWNQLKDLPYAIPAAMIARSMKQEAGEEPWRADERRRQRRSALTAAIGVAALAKAVAGNVLLVTKGFDLSFGGNSFALQPPDPTLEGTNHAPAELPGTIPPAPSDAPPPPVNPPAAPPAETPPPSPAQDPPAEVQPAEGAMDFAGDSIWSDSKALWQQHGVAEPTNAQIADVKNRILAFNGMTEARAANMAIGETYQIPAMPDLFGEPPAAETAPASADIPLAPDEPLEVGGGSFADEAPGRGRAPVTETYNAPAVHEIIEPRVYGTDYAFVAGILLNEMLNKQEDSIGDPSKKKKRKKSSRA